MTDEEIAQLDQELTPEEKTRLIRILCGPAEQWDDADSEFAMELYGVDPNLSARGLAKIVEGTIRKFRERGEELPQSLLNVLAKLQKKAKNSSNSIWKDRTLTATFRQPFDILAVTNTAWRRQKVAGACSGDLRPIWLPTLDTLRNFFLVPTVEMLDIFQVTRDVVP